LIAATGLAGCCSYCYPPNHPCFGCAFNHWPPPCGPSVTYTEPYVPVMPQSMARCAPSPWMPSAPGITQQGASIVTPPMAVNQIPPAPLATVAAMPEVAAF
jgi:hypothetical protein